jgi:hypothetical protein
MKSIEHRWRLLKLAFTILHRKQPLGVGLRNQCWAGLAIEKAKEHSALTTEYYGISFREMRNKIAKNNLTIPPKRNHVMAVRTILMSISK